MKNLIVLVVIGSIAYGLFAVLAMTCGLKQENQDVKFETIT